MSFHVPVIQAIAWPKGAIRRAQLDHSALPFETGDASSLADQEICASDNQGADLRGAPRFTMLIRSAKLITKQGEFVCVVRDVSSTGVRVRMFHKLPDEKQMALQMPSGSLYELCPIRRSGDEIGFQFVSRVDVDQLISEASEYPKRALRFEICFPLIVRVNGERWDAVVENISQQGARFHSDALFAIDQSVFLFGGDGAEIFPEIRAKVRWRRDDCYGVVFDDTFSLGDFARLCVELQSPMLATG